MPVAVATFWPIALTVGRCNGHPGRRVPPNRRHASRSAYHGTCTQGKIDWITITSSATAESVARMFGDAMNKMKIASLSPVTSETILEMGYQVTAEANPYTIDSLVEAISEAMTKA